MPKTRTSIDLDVLGLEEYLRQEQELLQDPLALASCSDAVQADEDLVAAFLADYEHTDGIAEKRALLMSTGSAFIKAPTVPRGSDDATKAWEKHSCTWCDHPEACKHDSTIPGCRIVEIDHKRRCWNRYEMFCCDRSDPFDGFVLFGFLC